MMTQAAAAPSVRVAGFFRRAAAGLVDAVILTAVFLLLDLLVALAMGQRLPRLAELGPDYLIDAAVNGGVLAEIGLVLLGMLAFLYFFIFHGLRGQTPGKQLVGVRVIDAYGQRPSLARALLRTVGYLPSALLLALGFIWIGFDREKRGLHDRLADTYVIVGRERRP